MRAAHAKLKEVTGGFNPKNRFKEGLSKILTEAQLAKLFPTKAKHEGEKPDAKHEGEKPKE
jgi:hypothetical protein